MPDFGEQVGHAADGFAPFQSAAELHVVNVYGDHMDASVSQDSRLDPNQIRASGSVSIGSGDDLVTADSRLRVRFEVAERTPFTLGAAFDVREPSTSLIGTRFDVELKPVGGGRPLIDEHLEGLDLLTDPDVVSSFARAGSLSPGRYELSLSLHGETSAYGHEATYRLDFATGDRPPNAVPLPPPAHAGLLTLAGVAGTHWRAAGRRRRLDV